MTDKIKEAKQSIEMARLLSEKIGTRDDDTRKEIREWLEDAQVNINGALNELDLIDKHRSLQDDDHNK